jgi:molybdopterin-guanine dinucleotide biosynthesis protein A
MLGVILAGGENRRFGSEKALVRLGDKLLIERILDSLKTALDEVVIITNSPRIYEHLGCTLLCDEIPGKGCLGGLYTGLRYSRGGSIFAVACDMPFLNGEFIKYMVGRSEGYDVVIPRTEALQPMHAIYSANCLPHMEDLMRRGNLKILDFFHKVRMKEIGPQDVARFDRRGIMFYNINTPQDLVEAERLFAGSSPISP